MRQSRHYVHVVKLFFHHAVLDVRGTASKDRKKKETNQTKEEETRTAWGFRRKPH